MDIYARECTVCTCIYICIKLYTCEYICFIQGRNTDLYINDHAIFDGYYAIFLFRNQSRTSVTFRGIF